MLSSVKPFEFTINRILRNILLLSIILTPIFTIGEVVAAFQGLFKSRIGGVYTPIYIKLMKDILIICIIYIGLFNIIINKKIYYNKYYYLFLILILFSCFISLFFINQVVILVGIRAFIPLLLVIFLYDSINLKFQIVLKNILIILFLLSFILQIFEFFYMPTWDAQNIWGYSSRNPGFFIRSNTMGFFLMIVLFYIHHFSSHKHIKYIFTYLLIPISIYLSGSGTAIVLFVIYLGLNIIYKIQEKWIILILIPFIVFFVFINISSLTSRKNALDSPLHRIEILTNIIGLKNLIISPNFGMGTNAAVLMEGQIGTSNNNSAIITDSTINSLIYNTGLFSCILFYVYFFKILNLSINGYVIKYSRIGLHIFIIYFIFSLTNVIYEIFPMNLIFAINISYFLRANRSI